MHLVTLGGLQLAGVAFGRVKPLLLLTYLALEGSKDRHHLAELFWPDAADPLNSLAAALKQLRQFAPGAAEGDHTHVSSVVECDATTFLQVVETGNHERALKLYRGPFLSGVHLPGWSAELEEWVYGTREYLAGRARDTLLRLGEALAAEGRFEEAAKRAEAAYLLSSAPEPEPEELVRFHTILTAGGSLQVSQLRKEARGYGIELSLSPTEARESLLRLSDSTPSPLHTLPSRPTSFVGRDAELVEGASALSEPGCSLLTLTGLGGIGKSRLALRIAEDLSGHFKGGVHFVPLGALTSADAIPFSIAEALSLRLQGSEDLLRQIAHAINTKPVLLVLDNYEHLLAGTRVVSKLLQSCPNLKLLVTSRERLNLEEEWVLPVEGLEFPANEGISLAEAQHYDALWLFLERAKRARLSFELRPEELPHAISICQRVEGLPLGIELAAAWVRVLSCQEIVQELENPDFLEAFNHNAPEQHKSVRAVFEGSWRLLAPKEQEVARKLSVFRGGFDRKAAGAVTGATLPILVSLVDKSLLRVSSGRYGRHPLLYQYTQEKLAEDKAEHEDTQQKHADYFLALAEEAEPEVKGVQQAVWLERLTEEHDNLRAALVWTQERQETRANLLLAGALSRFWWLRGHLSEGRRWLTEALALPGAANETAARAKALDGAGLIAWAQSDYASARLLHEESLAIYQTLKDKNGTAISLNNLGIVAHDQCDYASARSLHEKGLAIQRGLGNERGVALTLTNLGLAAHSQGDYTAARSLQEESLALFRMLSHKEGIALSLLNLALVVQDQGDLISAGLFHKESLKLWWELGSKRSIGFSLEGLAGLAVAQGEAERAARLWGAAKGLREMIGSPLPPSEHARYERTVAAARSQLSEAAFEVAWAEGRVMALEKAVTYALESVGKIGV